MIVHYVVLALIIFLMALVPFRNAETLQNDIDPLEVIPHRSYEDDCQTISNEKDYFLNIVITSTLDGIITALDGETGELMWRYEDDPLLKGTLANSGPIDIGGSRLQLLPTLDGRLFSFSLQSNLIEPLPITTETLLESTVRIGRDAVAGGKSFSTIGLNAITGEIKYKCDFNSCDNNDNDANLNTDPILLIKRISYSIRALDSLRGAERWNLSTAELSLSIAGVGLDSNTKTSTRFLLRPPEGVVHAMLPYNNEKWSAEVGGHIVGAWHVFDSSINEISIFDPTNIYTTQREVDFHRDMNQDLDQSLLYMGTSNGYPFIIQSQKSKQTLKMKMRDGFGLDATQSLDEIHSCSASTSENQIGYEVEDTSLLVVLRDAFAKSHSKRIEDRRTTSKRIENGKLKIVAHNTDSEVPMTCFGSQKTGVAMIGSENLRSTSLVSEGDRGYLILDKQSNCDSKYKLQPIPRMIKAMESMSSSVRYYIGLITAGLAFIFFKCYRMTKNRSEAKAITSSSSSERSSDVSIVRSRMESFAQTDEDSVATSNNELIKESTNIIDLEKENNKTDDHSELNESLMRLNMSNILLESATSPNKTEPAQPKTPALKQKRKSNEFAIDFSKDEESYSDGDNDEDDDSSLENLEKRKMLRSRNISRSSMEGFKSRFKEEYEVQNVMGRGGFGVVFRAKSKMDTIEYAVKRIAVADNDQARERVLRESRALATLDHPGIIRYFTTWEERPPKGFQEKEDEKLKELEKVKKRKSKKTKLSNEISDKKNGCSLAGSFGMPSIGADDAEDESSPNKVGVVERSTTESKKGLNGKTISSDPTVEETESDSSSSSSSSSSSNREQDLTSDGIHFLENDEDEKKRKSLSIKNRAILDATAENELEVFEVEEPRDCVYLYIVMQLCDAKTLEHWINKNSTIESRPIQMMKQWIRQLAAALEYLHGKEFIHRDLKPGNVLFSLNSNNRILKIGDLGLATKSNGLPKKNRMNVKSDEKHTKNVGTRSYMSPEQIENKAYTEKVDIFALGLVATELIIPFQTIMERTYTFRAYQEGIEPEVLKDYEESRQFLLELTNLDASQRPSAQEILDSAFLK